MLLPPDGDYPPTGCMRDGVSNRVPTHKEVPNPHPGEGEGGIDSHPLPPWYTSMHGREVETPSKQKAVGNRQFAT